MTTTWEMGARVKEYIDMEEAAVRLSVSEGFIEQMVAKGRLTPDEKNRLAADQVAELGRLMERLRGQGIAAMINAVGDDQNPMD